MISAYPTSLAHLHAELARLDLLIQVQVQRARQMQGAGDEFQGLYISEQEVDALLGRPMGLPAWAMTATADSSTELQTALAQLRAMIDAQVAESRRQGIELRLQQVAVRFHLTPFEVDLLLICLAPELDLRYEKLYAYLQDDVTKKRPTVDLALNLLSPSWEAKVAGRQQLNRQAPLRKYHLLHVYDDPAQPRASFLGQFLKLDERVADYLVGGDDVDTRLRAYVTCHRSATAWEQVLLPATWQQRLVTLAQQKLTKKQSLFFYFQGDAGVGKQSTAAALATTLEKPLLVVDGELLLQQTGGQNRGLQFLEITDIIVREAYLQNAVICWTAFDSLLTNENQPWRDLWLQALSDSALLVIVSGSVPWEPIDGVNSLSFVRVEFPPPSYENRVHLWTAALHKLPPYQVNGAEERTFFTTDTLATLANKFRLTGGQIEDAARTAYQTACWRDGEEALPTLADLDLACRLHSNRNLTTLAQKITPHYSWNDLVLPADRMQQLREICNQIKYRARVYEEWGFDQKLALGKGLNALFAGPSGTGKTMAAEVMAGELGLELYRIDLSSVVSKYIGETEKNLARIFAEAETSNAILFFDEADALFGKRSEVKDAHDRYANIEISYLLQRVEAYEGVVILATNFRRNMDDAFVRRLHFSIEFPLPSVADRQRIWQKVWPERTPRRDLDLEFMAARFELAGGNIRNIALAAAFLAADDGGQVEMRHLIRATQREYQKMGKVVVDGEFGAYAELARR